MTAKKFFIFCFFLMCQITFAQRDTIAIKEVLVSDAPLQNFSRTLSVTILNDSIIEKNAASLTSLLNYNSAIYFKENGLGMVSSPSFRGTSAQQTAVIWNGININSQLTGQTDFNTITTGNFDNISVRAGGGSSIYGSSAIGGSVHLNNAMHFTNQFANELRINYGSFNTVAVDYNIKASNEKASTQAGISRNSSENDYPYWDIGKRNENGQFYNTSWHANFGYKINSSNYLKLYSQTFEGERHFSGTLAAKSKSKYQDLNTRNLLEWDAIHNKWISKFKLAFLSERYRYFENAATENFDTSHAETIISKYDLGYIFNSAMSINGIVDYTQTSGAGSQIDGHTRGIGSAALLLRHQVLPKWFYEASIRKEITDNYKSPVLFSFGSRFDATKNYKVVLNVSRNFRIPTFNDLYWQGLGNINLKPESSYQAEVGQQFQWRKLFVSATAYYIDIKNLIQWTPNGDNGMWTPGNVSEVTSYGGELLLNWNKKFGKHALDSRGVYAFTVSENSQTKTQLQYVPKHKASANIAYSYKKWRADYQFLFNGFVYTPSKKYNIVKEYLVSNVALGYVLGKSETCQIGFRILNLWNEEYQSVLQRPMPGRNYNINLTFKF